MPSNSDNKYEKTPQSVKKTSFSSARRGTASKRFEILKRGLRHCKGRTVLHKCVKDSLLCLVAFRRYSHPSGRNGVLPVGRGPDFDCHFGPHSQTTCRIESRALRNCRAGCRLGACQVAPNYRPQKKSYKHLRKKSHIGATFFFGPKVPLLGSRGPCMPASTLFLANGHTARDIPVPFRTPKSSRGGRSQYLDG